MEAHSTAGVDLEGVGESFYSFLTSFQEETYEAEQEKLYIRLLQLLVEQGRRTLQIDFKHVLHFDRDLANTVQV